MITSKLTSKGQTTIPQAVRTALHLKEGDLIAYALEGNRVVMTHAAPSADDDPLSIFDEWNSDQDRAAYDNL